MRSYLVGEVDHRHARRGRLDDPVDDAYELVVEAVVAEEDDRARQPAWVYRAARNRSTSSSRIR
jgi:hypothetical protein